MNSSGFIESLVYYSGGVALLLLLLIVVKVAAKAMVSKRVRGVISVGMTLEDLERMRRTGLIYDEEYKRAKAKVAERMLESTLPKPSLPAEAALQMTLSEMDQSSEKAGAPGPAAGAGKKPEVSAAGAREPGSAAAPAAEKPRVAAGPGAPETGGATPDAPAAKAGKRPQGPLPLDVDQLRAAGVIDEAEYQRLKAYFARRRG